MNFWERKKVRLRAIEPTDAETFIRWNQETERGRYLEFLWPPTSSTFAKDWTEKVSKQSFENDCYHWLIETLEFEPVGTISTHNCNPRYGTFSYGIDITPEHKRKGYATEAIMIVLRYYFNELRYQKVTVPIHSDNQASIRLHERLGFQKEGVLRRMGFTNGHYIDQLWYGLTKEELIEKKNA